MRRDLLDLPFDDSLVQTREGRHGKALSVVASPAYIARLNEAFDGEWSFEIESHHVVGRHVVVLGKLTAGGVSKSAFGGAPIGEGERGLLADALDAAAMDALKKACSLLGLGLHLYDDARRPNPRPERPVDEPGTGEPVAPPATPRQRRAIDAITRALGWTPTALHELCLDVTGAPPGRLTKRGASKLISALQQLTVERAA